MTTMRVAGGLLTWAARRFSGRTALVFGDATLVYDEVEVTSNRFAHALASLGLRPGDRLGVLLNNSFDSVTCLFGAEKAGIVYVALNARHTLAEQAAILDDAQAAAVLVGPQFESLGRALAARPGTGCQVVGLGWGGDGVLDHAPLVALMPEHAPGLVLPADAPLRIGYTSGTTGQPKGVLYTIERWYQRLDNHFHAMEHGLGVDDAMLHFGPLTHAAGVHLLPCYLRGARNVIEERFDPRQALRDIERHRITQLMCVPTMLGRLLDAIDAGPRTDTSWLQRIHYGTAPASPALIRRALATFGPILRQQYGMTEAVQPLCVLYPHEHATGDERLLRSCGKPSANVTISVRDAAGRDLPAGEVGEITIAHEGIGRVAFWRRPELLAEVVRDGWYYTGDLGRFDADGYLTIVGRNKEMIISGGFNVYAREVEDALATHPAVAECAVVGLPDPDWGERVAAQVVLRPGVAPSEADLIEHCATLIAGYKKPRLIGFADALPRNEAGKVLKNRLRQEWLARLPETTT